VTLQGRGDGAFEDEGGGAGRAGHVHLSYHLRIAQPDGCGEDARDLLQLPGELVFELAGRVPQRVGGPVHSQLGTRQELVAWSTAMIAASSGESPRRAAPVRVVPRCLPSGRAATRTQRRCGISTMATP